MKQLYFYVSDVMLIYTSLPSLPHSLRTTVDHKRLSIFWSRLPQPRVWPPMHYTMKTYG